MGNSKLGATSRKYHDLPAYQRLMAKTLTTPQDVKAVPQTAAVEAAFASDQTQKEIAAEKMALAKKTSEDDLGLREKSFEYQKMASDRNYGLKKSEYNWKKSLYEHGESQENVGNMIAVGQVATQALGAYEKIQQSKKTAAHFAEMKQMQRENKDIMGQFTNALLMNWFYPGNNFYKSPGEQVKETDIDFLDL